WLIGLACDICGSTDGAGGNGGSTDGAGGSDCDASANAVMAVVWFVDGCLMLNGFWMAVVELWEARFSNW
ncbi:hypothetical protein WICPIJ_007487, partial [Wickerhamomyces pijperi]